MASSFENRLNEYFVVVGLGNSLVQCNSLQQDGDEQIAANYAAEGLNGHPLNAEYQAEILDRYPFEDHEDTPFPPGVVLFCFPQGLRLSREMTIPKFSFFVHTNALGEKLFGTCLHFYENITHVQSSQLLSLLSDYWEAKLAPTPPPVQGSEEEKTASNLHQPDPLISEGIVTEIQASDLEATLFAPKCLCVLSRWCFPEPTREWLAALYRSHTQPSMVPLERAIANFILEVPLPLPGMAVQCQLLDQPFTFSRPPDSDPFSLCTEGVPLRPLFECLSPENVLDTFTAICLERHILFCSSSLSTLTYSAEALLALLYPLQWHGVYIPILPNALFGVLDAPVPIIVGIKTEMMDSLDHQSLEHFIQVNLDKDMLSANDLSKSRIPERKRRSLLSAINNYAGLFASRESDWEQTKIESMDLAFSQPARPDELPDDEESDGNRFRTDWSKLRSEFLSFHVSMLKNYASCIEAIDPDTAVKQGLPPYVFRHEAYIQGHKEDWEPFLSKFISTQMFQNFLTEQALAVFGKSVSPWIGHFNQCIAVRLKQGGKLHRKAVQITSKPIPLPSAPLMHKTVVAPVPSIQDLPAGATYSYANFPVLDQSLDLKRKTIVKHLHKRSETARLHANDKYTRTSQLSQPISHTTAIYSSFFMIYTAVIIKLYKRSLSNSHFRLCSLKRDIGGGKSKSPPLPPRPRQPSNEIYHQRFATVSSGKVKVDSIAQELNVQWKAQETVFYHLDVLFEILEFMKESQVKVDVMSYQALMAVCSQCGAAKHAAKVVSFMKADGISPNVGTYGALVQSITTKMASSTVFESSPGVHSDDQVKSRKRSCIKHHKEENSQINSSIMTPSKEKEECGVFSGIFSSNAAEKPTPKVKRKSLGFFETKHLQKDTSSTEDASATHTNFNGTPLSVFRDGSAKHSPFYSLHPLDEQLERSRQLLSEIFNTLEIDVDQQVCPHCQAKITFENVQRAWTNDLNTYTIKCPHCLLSKKNLQNPIGFFSKTSDSVLSKIRFWKPSIPEKASELIQKSKSNGGASFVARFSVSYRRATNYSEEGSIETRIQLQCEFLSPFVLRKELDRMLNDESKEDTFCTKQFWLGNQSTSTIFWNLLMLFKKYELPFAFLLEEPSL